MYRGLYDVLCNGLTFIIYSMLQHYSIHVRCVLCTFAGSRIYIITRLHGTLVRASFFATCKPLLTNNIVKRLLMAHGGTMLIPLHRQSIPIHKLRVSPRKQLHNSIVDNYYCNGHPLDLRNDICILYIHTLVYVRR